MARRRTDGIRSDGAQVAPGEQRKRRAVATVLEALADLDERQAGRVLLAAAILLECDVLITDLAKRVVWVDR